MLWFLDHLSATLLGLIYGLVRGIYLFLKEGVLNMLASLWVYTMQLAQAIWLIAAHLMGSEETLRAWTDFCFSSIVVFDDEAALFILLLFVAGIAVMGSVYLIINFREIFALVRDIIGSTLRLTYNLSASLIISVAMIPMATLLGAREGLLKGNNGLFSSIFGLELLVPLPDSADLEMGGVSEWHGREADGLSVNAVATRAVRGLAYHNMSEVQQKNDALMQLIAALPPTQEYQELMAKYAGNGALKAEFDRLTKDYSCCFTIADLGELEQPLVIEYQLPGEASQKWHTKVFETAAILRMGQLEAVHYLRLPENRVELTGADRHWEKNETTAVLSSIREGQLNAGIRIYKGVPTEMKEKLAVMEQELKSVPQPEPSNDHISIAINV